MNCKKTECANPCARCQNVATAKQLAQKLAAAKKLVEAGFQDANIINQIQKEIDHANTNAAKSA